MRKEIGLRRAELGLGLAVLVVLVAVRLSVLRHAGPLWRDEVTSFNLASAPSALTVLGLTHLDSFPALWPLLLHAWIAVGLGHSDATLRILGLAIGLGTLGVLGWTVRRLHCEIPLLSLALFGASPTVFLYGDAVRGYGVGVACLLFLLGAIWKVTEDPRPRSIAIALAAALLAVHSAFASSVLLLALCLAGGMVALRRGAPRTVGILLGIGAAAGVSVLPYLRTVARYGEWNIIVQSPIGISRIFRVLTEAIGGKPMIALWGLLFLFSTAVCLWFAYREDPPESTGRRDLALFLPIAATAGLIGFLVYLKTLSVPTQTWYYLAPMALLAVYFDAAVNLAIAASWPSRIVRMVLVAGVIALTAGAAWEASRTRMTNLDRVAEEIAKRSAPEDLVVLNPWYAGVTLERYYRGKAPWISVPDFDERRFQPYPDFKRKMAEREPLKPVLEKIGRTLEGGHRIWLIGGLPFLRWGERVQELPPAPGSPAGWSEGAYEWTWVRQAAYYVQTHATRNETIPVPVEEPVSHFENLSLQAIDGWRASPSR